MKSPSPSRPLTRLIQAVQIARRKVASLADDESWRPYLFRMTGIESLRAMNGRQLGIVLDDLARQAARTPAMPKKPNRWSNACDQAKMVLSLWLELYRLGGVDSKHDGAIDAFVERQTGLKSANWLIDPAAAAAVIEPLKIMIRRAKRGQPEGDAADG